ncbi:Phototropic-responsive NPH3 family protein [Raphanus sativus]|uniref:Coleoptile phototropism protein 1-like n=1 Tax=Raphanus sativus TaxID=3726 RepID=A0A9W3DR93_RAPSA|nr:coleoptile phototropism protein 1-like [Raphanus sativus]KAJ4898018.1 Phototropic-responsive NPH3 family protein [Raphanus sativus]
MDYYSWFDEASIQDMNYFVKTITGIKSKGIRPDVIGSIIAHYASKWLPDLSGNLSATTAPPPPPTTESVTASVMKKRFFVETLTGILPPEKDSVPCNFLLRLLRTAKMVGTNQNYLTDLENRVSWQLDQASLKELMIPSFSHTCGTLLDVELVTRLVKKFVGLDSEGVKTGAALVKVAKLVDSYLAEAAIDGGLTLLEFISLIKALPSHARTTEDGLYRAVDTYLKAHPQVLKQERKALCRLIDSRKLSPEAALHAAQNDRLPVRSIIRVLFTEQTKISRHIDWSPSASHYSEPGSGPQCLSKREMNVQQAEIKRLRDDVLRLQSECGAMHMQLERLMEKKSGGGSKGFFRWKRPSTRGSVGVEKMMNGEEEVGDNGEGLSLGLLGI